MANKGRNEAAIWVASAMGMCGYMLLKLAMLGELRRRRAMR